MSVKKKSRILLVGCGGIGTCAALALETGGLASVTAILRSNYNIVKDNGFTIDSQDHGKFESWRPSELRRGVPDVAAEGLEPFDYVVCTTKNVPEIPPKLADLIRPAVTPKRSVIVLVQNGLNIERPLLEAFPHNICLSGVSLCGANEPSSGHIVQDDPDRLTIGPFTNPNVDYAEQEQAAKHFVRLYSACEKVTCTYDPDVLFVRWRKLMYNAVWNPVCALTGLDTTMLRVGAKNDDPKSPVAVLVRPAMEEIRAAALAAANVKLDPELVDKMIEADPLQFFCQPSMMQDVEKGRYIEYENIVGQALTEGENAGVSMPVIRTLYGLCKAIQWHTMEKNGLTDVHELLKQRS